MYFYDIQLTNVLAAATAARLPNAYEETSNQLFKIYPNTADKLLNLGWDAIKEDVQISLSDEVERVVLAKFNPAGNIRKVYPLTLPALRAGYYYLRVVSGERKETRRVMVKQ